MNIEKLGIELIKSWKGSDWEWIKQKSPWCREPEVRKLEEQHNKMLEALIVHCMKIEQYNKSKCTPNQLLDVIHFESIKIIEKADPQHRAWEQIKKVLNASEETT